jgi:hypothetical protein
MMYDDMGDGRPDEADLGRFALVRGSEACFSVILRRLAAASTMPFRPDPLLAAAAIIVVKCMSAGGDAAFNVGLIADIAESHINMA